jgi:predicted Zn-dependent protease
MHRRRIALYRQLLTASPGSADLHVSLGHSLKTLGRQKEATASYQMAAGARPSFGDAWWSLANLKTYRFSENEIAHPRAEETAPAARHQSHRGIVLPVPSSTRWERDYQRRCH